MQERFLLNEARVVIDALTRDLEMEQEASRRDAGALEVERERANNLQSVLEDFQAGGLHFFHRKFIFLINTQQRITRFARRSQISNLDITR